MFFRGCRPRFRRFDGISRRKFLWVLFPTVAWPVALGPRQALRAARYGQNTFRRRRTRLVYAVDDEPAITELYRLALGPSGYGVKTFHNRVEALLALVAETPQPDLLITDYEGYPISAESLIHTCRHTRPRLKVLMATGYSSGFLGSITRKVDGFLLKPFSVEQLLAAVGSLIGRNHD